MRTDALLVCLSTALLVLFDACIRMKLESGWMKQKTKTKKEEPPLRNTTIKRKKQQQIKQKKKGVKEDKSMFVVAVIAC